MFVAALLLAGLSAGTAAGIIFTPHVDHSAHKPPPSPIVCILTNGDRLRGDVTSITRTSIHIVHSALGKLTLRRRQIAVCTSPDSTVLRKLGSQALAPVDTQVVMTVAFVPPLEMMIPVPPAPAPVSLDRLAKAVAPVPLASRALPNYASSVGWKRSIGATYSMARGNANTSDLGFTGSIVRRSQRSQIALNAKRLFSSQEGHRTADFFSATLRYDLALGPNDSAAAKRPSFFAETIYEHDPFAQVGSRAVENTGVSIPLSQDPRHNLAVEVGAGVTHEAPADVSAYTRAGGLIRLAARQLFGRAQTTQEIAAFPDLSGPYGHYRLNTDLSVSAPLAKSLSLKIGISNRYDTRPQTDVRKSDTSIRSGIGFEF